MPERLQATTKLTEHLLGGPIQWDGLNGVVREPQPLRTVGHSFAPREPIELTQTVWDTTYAEADAIYRMIIGKIDWNRVFIEAAGLHNSRLFDKDDDHEDYLFFEEVCPDCIQQVLLTTER